MSIRLSEEDQLFRDHTRRWVDAQCPKDWCRELEAREHEFPMELWDRLTEFGAHGIGIPENYGSQGGAGTVRGGAPGVHAGGTDLLGGLRTKAERCDGGWVVSGEKIWSTGASVADYLLVLARSDAASRKISLKNPGRLTGCPTCDRRV